MKRFKRDIIDKSRKRPGLKVLIAVLSLIILLLLFVAFYLLYVRINYKRIKDNLAIAPVMNSYAENGKQIETGKEYSIMTLNLGFGAYCKDFDFFMDGGTRGRAFSEQTVLDDINGSLNKITSKDPDIVIFQECDEDGTRSWHVNEIELIDNRLNNYYRTFTYNYYKSPYFIVPPLEMHGTFTTGILTYSKFMQTGALRRSLPVNDSITKYFDLDRCYMITRIPVANGKELCIINLHLSAYGSDEKVREGQLSMLFADMKAEYDKGNYIICGGDFNHDLRLEEGEPAIANWAYPFPRSELPEHFSMAMDLIGEENKAALLSSVRDCDEPYEKGHTTETIVDGFIVSDNVEVLSYEDLYEGFLYSDHEPVYMVFSLKDTEN